MGMAVGAGSLIARLLLMLSSKYHSLIDLRRSPERRRSSYPRLARKSATRLPTDIGGISCSEGAS